MMSITVALAFCMFVVTGFLSLIGTVRVSKIWEKGDYKIKYVIDQGFSGGPLRTYQLYKYSTLPVLIKHVEEKVDNDTTNDCQVNFLYKKFKFDKCRPPVKEYHYDYGYSLF